MFCFYVLIFVWEVPEAGGDWVWCLKLWSTEGGP